MCLILVSVKFQTALLKYFPALLLNSTGGRIKQAQAQFEANLVSAKLSPPQKKCSCTDLHKTGSILFIQNYILLDFSFIFHQKPRPMEIIANKKCCVQFCKEKMMNFIFGLTLVIKPLVNFFSDYLNVFPLLWLQQFQYFQTPKLSLHTFTHGHRVYPIDL